MRREEIIVTMTSWRGRIGNVRPVAERLLEGVLVPDRIVCNLSSDEFPLREAELPVELCEFAALEPRFEIWWVRENNYAFKKLLPTLERFPEAVVITVDDDFYYGRGFIKDLYDTYVHGECRRPVTIRRNHFFGMFFACGAGSLYKRDFFGDRLGWLDDEILSTREDDWFYTYSLLLGGVLFMPAERSDVKLLRPFNPVAESKERLYNTNITRKILDHRLELYTGMTVGQLVEKVKRENYGYTERDFRHERWELKKMRCRRRLIRPLVNRKTITTN